MHFRTHPLFTAALFLTVFLVRHSSPCFAQAPVPHSSHVVLLADENTSYATTLAEMPWLAMEGAANGHAANYFSNTSGSLMDYLWLASGSCESGVNCALPSGTHDFGCNGNDCAQPITDDNIFRELNNRGISWKVYAQSYAAAGGTVTTPDFGNGTHYYRRHNGATWYSDILSDTGGSQANIVDFSEFAKDLANGALPRFSIIAPDGLNDGHDTGPAAADNFLRNNLPALLAQPYFQPGGDGLLAITFDNGDGDGAGQVYTAVIGPNVTPNTVSQTAYKHQNTLRTLLDALGIGAGPGASATAAAMRDFFSGYVTVASPAANAVTGSQVQISASATETKTQVDELQIWDGTTGQKLAESSPGASTINQSFSFAPGLHQIVVEDLGTGNFQVLHKSIFTISVLPVGVTVTSPAPNSTSGTQVLVSASAMETSGPIFQLQVWDNTTGQKLAESAPGTSTISQTIALAPGTHQIVAEDIHPNDFQPMHKSSVTVNVLSSAGVTVLSPANNSAVLGPVVVSAYANSTTAIDHMEVWDAGAGTKLGDSPGSQVETGYSLTPGQHTLVVQSIGAGNFQVLDKTRIGITVQ